MTKFPTRAHKKLFSGLIYSIYADVGYSEFEAKANNSEQTHKQTNVQFIGLVYAKIIYFRVLKADQNAGNVIKTRGTRSLSPQAKVNTCGRTAYFHC